MISIVRVLEKQRLIAARNNYQAQLLNNYSSQRRLLNNVSFMGGNLKAISDLECSINLDSINASTQLMAINAELESINNSSLNYFA